jgi:hypothetical protein
MGQPEFFLRSFAMKKVMLLIVSCALAFPGTAFAQSDPAKPASTHASRKPHKHIIITTGGGILRQDLFDRNNPNNVRSDWPTPPAQAAQF